MNTLFQILLTGVAVGVIYGAVGTGFVVVHRMTGMVNFAQGDIAVSGAFVAVVASGFVPPPLAVLAGGVGGAIVSVLLYRLAVRPLESQGLLVQTIVTLGAGIVIRSILQLIFGTGPRQFGPFTGFSSFSVAGASMNVQSLWVIGVGVLASMGLVYFLARTTTGLALSACAVNPMAAGIVGIKRSSMATIAFALAGAIPAVVLATQVPLSFITVGAGFTLGLKGFIAAILGGFDKPGLAMVGGILVGIAEAAANLSISTSYSEAMVFALLIVLLIARPSGLTRMKVSERV